MTARIYRHPTSSAGLRHRPPVHQRESMTGDPYRLDDGIPVLSERLHKIDTEALPGGQGLAIGATALPKRPGLSAHCCGRADCDDHYCPGHPCGATAQLNQELAAHRERARRAINAKPVPIGPTLGQAMFASGCVAIAILAVAVSFLPGFALKALSFLGGLFGAPAA
jgi:hypothetical protein